MMLNIDSLSYWERKTFFEDIDFLIVGAGIVGSNAALSLRAKYPDAKIVVIEQGYLPSGASTKNAGFACFGSPTEILDDLSNASAETVWKTVSKRWEGLQALRQTIGEDAMDFQQHGSWDLILPEHNDKTQLVRDRMAELNREVYAITGVQDVFSESAAPMDQMGMRGITAAFRNKLEAQIDTGKMMVRLHQLLGLRNILLLTNVRVEQLLNDGVLKTNIGQISAHHLLIATNGFAQQLLPELDVKPARAQVLVTSPIDNLKIRGTFHLDAGYYYFRNVENRILLGGGRNLDFEGETSTELSTTEPIQARLDQLLKEVILPGIPVQVDYRWAGIMGVGQDKNPIVRKISPKITVGVKMGGMGVAIGTLIGQEMAQLQ